MTGLLGLFAIAVAVASFFRITTVAFVWLAVADVLIVAMVFVVLLGIGGTAKLPRGLDVVQFFFARERLACHLADGSDGSSDDEGSGSLDGS